MAGRTYKTLEAYRLNKVGPESMGRPLEVLVYGGVLGEETDLGQAFARIFYENAWGRCRQRRVLPVDQFRSDAHEGLAVAEGSGVVLLGGCDGRKVDLRRGDLLLLPAGTAHRLLECSPDFRVISAMPDGEGEEGLKLDDSFLPRAQVSRAVQSVPCPETDPLFGQRGPLIDFWCMPER